MKILYFDLDGLLADMDGRVEEITGHKINELDQKQFWKTVSKTKDFFRNLDPFPLADVVRNTLLHSEFANQIHVLTSSGSNFEEVAPQKIAWAVNNLGISKDKIHVVTSGVCKSFWATPSSILIDDTEKVITAWVEAGGIGILHKSGVDDDMELLSKLNWIMSH